ncbi:MAG: 3-deoxy-7-phosphoheptulonate synthase [Acidobacteriota bacterium]|jgi:3-deoxy-7-phosphoheptulonate synthase
MLVIMKLDATPEDLERVLGRVDVLGGEAEVHRPRQTIVSIRGGQPDPHLLQALPGVETVQPSAPGYWLASRRSQAEDTVIRVRGRAVGGSNPPLMIAGPCAVESEDQLLRSAEAALEAGAQMLRGGAFKPRSSPYSFQGLGERGLEMLARVRERFGVPIVTEMRDAATLELFQQYDMDVIQLGARNMQNFEILRRAGAAGRPVLLKRGPSATIEEWLMAAEYVMLSGNPDVILCERGVLPPASVATRYHLDVAAIPIVRRLSHLPVIADPSHAAGARELVTPLAEAAVAAGAQGLLVEVHSDPCQALCDARQALEPAQARELVERLRRHGYLPARSAGSVPRVDCRHTLAGRAADPPGRFLARAHADRGR